jgi:hypothetical protein
VGALKQDADLADERRLGESTMQSEARVSKRWEHACERRLPRCVRDVLEAARRARPGTEITCVSFHSRHDGSDITAMEMSAEATDRHRPPVPRVGAKDLLVLSVAVTETTFETVETVTHVLVTRTRTPGSRG